MPRLIKTGRFEWSTLYFKVGLESLKKLSPTVWSALGGRADNESNAVMELLRKVVHAPTGDELQVTFFEVRYISNTGLVFGWSLVPASEKLWRFFIIDPDKELIKDDSVIRLIAKGAGWTEVFCEEPGENSTLESGGHDPDFGA